MIIFPYKTDSGVQKIPAVNLVFTSAVLILSMLFLLGKLDFRVIEFFMLSKWNVLKLIGTVLIQPDIISTAAVFVFLLLIGNSINSIIGNFYYLLCIVFFCAVSSSVHLLTGIIPAIGANGLISALAGFALMILPANRIIVYKDELDDVTGISISALVVMWILFDIYAIIEYRSIVILWAHLAGFASGIITAIIFIKTKTIVTLNATFTEWLYDLFSSVPVSEILTIHRREKADVDSKTRAGRLLKLYDVHYDNPETEKELAGEPEKPKEPELQFRLLKAVKQKDHITLYFVYKGEEVTGLSIYSENYKCEIYPTAKLKPGDSGSIKIYSGNFSNAPNISLTINSVLNGKNTAKEIVFSLDKNELRN